MSTFLEGLLLHTNGPDLTLHWSVEIPDIVPVVVDVTGPTVGSARLFWNGSDLRADVTLEETDYPGLPVETQVIPVYEGTNIFVADHDGHTYGMEGGVIAVSVLTLEAIAKLSDVNLDELEEYIPAENAGSLNHYEESE